MDALWQWVGFLGFVILLPVSWFQIFTNYKRRSTEGVSVLMFATLFVGLMLMFSVAVHDGSAWAIILNFGIGAVSAFIVLCQMYWYSRKHIGGAR